MLVVMKEVLGRVRSGAPLALLGFVVLLLVAGCAPITPEAPGNTVPMPAETPMAMEEPTAVSTGEIPTVTFAYADGAVTGPAEVPSGIVRFVFEGVSEDGWIDIAYVTEGTAMDDVTAALQQAEENPAAVLDLVRIFGVAGDATEAIYDLPEGDYLAVYKAGWPDFATMPFATGAASGAAAPEADVLVQLDDFAFIMPDTVPAGESVWEFSNTGDQWHMMLIVKPAEGQTADDVMAMMMGEGDPNAAEPEFMSSFEPISQGNRAWVTMDLPPGKYLAVCPLPDLKTMQMDHASLGMVREFTVE